MQLNHSKKISIEQMGLKYKLFIVEALIFLLPFLTLSYLFYKNGVSFESSEMAIFALILLLILAAFLIVRNMVEGFLGMTSTIERALGNTESIDALRESTNELDNIGASFNKLMDKFDATTLELQQRVYELHMIKKLHEVAMKLMKIDDLLDTLLEHAMAVTGATIGSILLPDAGESDEKFQIVISKGAVSEQTQSNYVTIGKTLAQKVVNERRPVLIQDIKVGAENTEDHETSSNDGSFLSVPVFAREKLIAVLNLSHKENGRPFADHDEQICTIFINEIGFALENAYLHSKVEKNVQALEHQAKELTTANEHLVQEISERRRAEKAMRDTLQTAEEIVSGIPAGLLIYQYEPPNQLRLIDGNPSAERLTGINLEECRGKEFNDIWPGAQNFKIPEKFFGAIISGQTFESEDLYYQDDRFNGNFKVRAFPMQSNRLGVAFENVTERIKAQKALHESEEKYRLLFENASDSIFIIQDNKVKFANPKAKEFGKYLGIEKNEQSIFDYIHPEDRKNAIERHQKRLKGEYLPQTYSLRLWTKDKKEIWVEQNAVLIEWEGKPATLNFLRDITEKKKLETQVQKVQRMEAIGTLAGGIAHNFNNLLMGIQSSVSVMLLEMGKSDSNYDKIKSIERCVKSGGNLTKQLLGFARGGKYVVKPLKINRIVKETAKLFGDTNKTLKIHEKYQKDIWTTEIDAGQIEQVLLNLYLNALQAMPEGGDLFLESENVILKKSQVRAFNAKEGEYVKITVRDTGIGMDASTKTRIFEPFYTTKKMKKGAGLGLASAYGIIKNHDGFIDFTTTIGKGTSFYIYLPASGKKAVRERKVSNDLLKGNETILLVDDEKVVINAGKQMLNLLGYTPIIAFDGEEAVEIYKQQKTKIALVVLDIIMPGIGGGEVYDKLKSIDPDVKVLLSSGYSINVHAKSILDRGCNGFLQKPFDINVLSQRIRRILDN